MGKVESAYSCDSRILVETYNGVEGLIAVASEVEVVRQAMFATAINSMEHDLHVKFAPSLLLEMERWLFEC